MRRGLVCAWDAPNGEKGTLTCVSPPGGCLKPSLCGTTGLVELVGGTRGGASTAPIADKSKGFLLGSST